MDQNILERHEPLPGGFECEAGPPLLIPVRQISKALGGVLEDCAKKAGCRVYGALDLESAYVIAGYPQALGALRSLLVAHEGLRFVREEVEATLGRVATPDGISELTAAGQKKTSVENDVEIPKGTTLFVSREFSFDAAHNLPRYNGKCEKLHGHTFKLKVTVKAELDTWSGMAFDFSDLKKIVNSRVITLLDHAYVNEIISNPSAEFIAVWVWQRLSDLPLHEIQVWETPSCCVTYSGPPRAEG